MSMFRICDGCGESIEVGQPFITLTAVPEGGAYNDQFWTRHYCARGATSPNDARTGWCADKMRDALDLASAHRRIITPLETITGQKLGHLRRRHTKPEDDA